MGMEGRAKLVSNEDKVIWLEAGEGGSSGGVALSDENVAS